MGFYTHISVIMACDENDRMAIAAKQHLDKLDFERSREAQWFLQDLSKRSGRNYGPKGGVSLWGMIGNYTVVEDFIETLMPFWDIALGKVDGGPLDFESINILFEPEQSESTQVFEIRRKNRELENPVEVINHGKMPFQFHQM